MTNNYDTITFLTLYHGVIFPLSIYPSCARLRSGLVFPPVFLTEGYLIFRKAIFLLSFNKYEEQIEWLPFNADNSEGGDRTANKHRLQIMQRVAQHRTQSPRKRQILEVLKILQTFITDTFTRGALTVLWI